jgi:hypothetical protein
LQETPTIYADVGGQPSAMAHKTIGFCKDFWGSRIAANTGEQKVGEPGRTRTCDLTVMSGIGRNSLESLNIGFIFKLAA